MRLFLFGSFVIVASACTSAAPSSSTAALPETGTDAGPSSGDDAGTDATAAFTPAPHPAWPVVPNQGGPIVAHPEIVTVTWSADPIAADLEAFDGWMVASAFWKDLMAEWGVGPGTHGATYRIPTAAPATLDEAGVQKVIEDGIAAGKLPAPSADRIYAVYPPSGTTVTNFGVAGCDVFQAYHSSFAPTGGGALAVYAITPRCAQTQGMTALDYTTWGMSHEIMEASTDPDAQHPTYVILQQSLATPELGENADLCTGHPTRVDGHMVTRNWSNTAAAKGERPCAPAPAGPGFGAYADPGELTVAAGGTATVKVRAWSGAEMPAFQLVAYAGSPELTAKLSAKTGANGDELTLTVTATAAWTEQMGANTVSILAIATDYQTRTSVIVHGK